MNFDRLATGVLPPALLVLGGMALQPIAPPAGPAGRPDLPAVAAQGLGLAMLGGYRALAADGLWLRTNLAWEKRDAVRTEALIRATVAADDRAEYFRLNGARMLAFDLPTWQAQPGEPAAVTAARNRAHAERALALLQAGLHQRGPSTAYWIEMGRITHLVLGQKARAAEYYGRAAERPDAPYFAGRLRIELLVAEGRLREARAWLRAWLPRLPRGEPAAQRERMEARLAEIEGRLAGN